MKAILNKTVGPNFMAGDVIVGDHARIKRLVDSGVATPDHSRLGMIGCVVTWITCSFLVLLAVASWWAHELAFFGYFTLSSLWRWTFIVLGIWTIVQTIRHFNNGKMPYIAYFMSFATNVIGGLMIMIGHERATSRYQDKKTSSTAAVILFTAGAIAFAIAFLNIWHWNHSDSGIPGANVNAEENFHNLLVWTAFWVVMVIGMSMAKYFDFDFQKRRKRFIAFLRKKNATIEYKTKALQTWRAYKATGNADKFMEKNIELIEESLDIDRQQVTGSEYKAHKKNKKKNKWQ